MLKRLKTVDFYRKIPVDYTEQTVLGGLLSVLSGTVICLLFTLQTYYYIAEPYTAQFSIEGVPPSDRIRLDLNISFFHLPCEILAAHYTDVSGSHYTATTLHRVRISNKGVYLWDREHRTLDFGDSSNIPKAACGSCYGAELSVDQCCNSCEEVFEAYQRRKWQLPQKQMIAQCSRKLTEVGNTEGCCLFGHMLLKKVPSNFHFALTAVGQMMLATGNLDIDGSHRVHTLVISDPQYRPQRMAGPIDGHFVQNRAVTQYYLRMAPAVLPSGWRFYETSVHMGHIEGRPPEVVFQYDIEPITTSYVPRQSFLEYLVTLCGLIGGWYAVTLLFSHCLSIK